MEEQGHLRNFEATLRRKDGSPIHVLINAFGLYDNQGRLLQIRGLMLDVTGLRTYQSELHRERDFSGKILSNTQSLILVADTAGLISYANRRWYDAGFEQRELLGHPLLELAGPDLCDRWPTLCRARWGPAGRQSGTRDHAAQWSASGSSQPTSARCATSRES